MITKNMDQVFERKEKDIWLYQETSKILDIRNLISMKMRLASPETGEEIFIGKGLGPSSEKNQKRTPAPIQH